MLDDKNVLLKFKEILYFCLEELKATKAAFYLLAPDGKFYLKASYGFTKKDVLTEVHEKNSPIVEALYIERKAFYYNSIAEAGDLKTCLLESNTSRILISPVYLERIAGFLDIRDKAAKEPFNDEDLSIADGIALRFSSYLQNFKSKKQASPVVVISEIKPEQELKVYETIYSKVQAIITTPDPKILKPVQEPPQTFLNSFYKIIDLFFHLEDFAALVLFFYTPKGSFVIVGGRYSLSEDIVQKVAQEGKTLIAQKIKAEIGNGYFINKHFPMGEKAHTGKIFRAFQHIISLKNEYQILFNYFSTKALGKDDLQTLSPFVSVAKSILNLEMDKLLFEKSYKALLQKLLQPGLEDFSSLIKHSFAVCEIVREFCKSLQLDQIEVERISLAGLLHDIGMRELDYKNLYHKKKLQDDELRLLQQHPKVGAYLIQNIPFPYEIYTLILHHHERWDGSGYPSQLMGEDIPLGARIIHIIEAYDAMTSKTSYRPIIDPTQALETLKSKAGVQFDPTLVPKFLSFIQIYEYGKASHQE